MNTLPDHLFVSSCEGHLYDTRIPNWHKLPPLRPNYSRHVRDIKTLADVKASLRAGPYAWPGGYECFFITRDGACLCFGCARKEFRQIAWDFQNDCSTGWRVKWTARASDFEGAENCDHCNTVLVEGIGGSELEETV